MFYKKWTFSLKILVMLLAIGLVAIPSVMAGEFGSSLDMTHDMSTNGGLQLERSSAVTDGKFSITVTFARAIVLPAAKVLVTTYDKDSVFVAAPKATVDPTTAAAEITITIPVGDTVTSVIVKIAKGIASSDLFNDDTTAEFKQTIQLIADDEGMPVVHSIRRVSDPLLPLTKDDTTVQVVVTLSEKPREFKKDHISVTEADVADPVALDPIAEVTASVLVAQGQVSTTILGGAVPVLRGLYDNEDRHGGTYTGAGIHAAIDDDDNSAETALEMAITAYNVLAETNLGDVDAVFLSAKPDPLPTAFPHADFGMEVTVSLATSDGVSEAIDDLTFPDASVDPGDAPDPGSFATLADYDNANDIYLAKKKAFDTYTAGVAVRDAYLAAVKVEVDADNKALADYLSVTLTDDDRPVTQLATGRDNMLHPFVVTITPKFNNKNAIVVKVKEFEDMTSPVPNKYMPPMVASDYTEGVDKLTIKVGYEKPKAALSAGLIINLPNEKRIPNGGYIVFTTKSDESGIKKPAGSDKDEPKAAERTPAQLLYNVVDLGLPNLETFLGNGGTIDLVGPENVIISEIMWGSDASLTPNNNSQWIEIKNNSGKSLLTGDKTYKLIFYGPNEVLPAVTTVKDRVGTVGAGGYWSIQSMGRSGRTGTGEQAADITAVVPTLALASMQRVVVDGTDDGTLVGSWAISTAPALNFDPAKEGVRIGSPGSAPVAYPTAPTPEPTPTPPTPEPTVPVATATDLAITEIMVATDNGRLPQWIEITNTSSAAVSLTGWTIEIMNTDDDADAVGTSISAALSGTIGVGEGVGNGDGEGESLLLVAWTSRNSRNFNEDRVMSLATALGQTGRYKLLSEMGFRVCDRTATKLPV